MVYPPEEDAAGRAQGADALIATAPAEFPATGTLTYMNVGSRGLMSRRVRAALGELLDDHTFGAGNREAWKTAAAEARALFARLINAATDEVVLTRNTSDGLNALANAMPWQSGDNMVVTPDLEEPTTIYAWYNLRRLGVEVRDVLPRGPFYDIERMVDAIDSRTRLLVACSETWAPGLRTDIDTLGRACRERGVFFVVDAVQSAGVMPLDV